MKTLGHESASLDTDTSLSDIEHDRRGPSDSMLRALAKALDTTFEDLKQLDDWPVIKEIKRRILIDPKLMFSVRRLLEAKVPAEALIKLAEDKSKTKEEMKTIPPSET